MKTEDIREIWSHEQAIQQCSGFLAENKQWRVNICSNTAAAAQMVAESGRKDVAAISSAHCAPLYGLEILKTDIQNNGNNHTRFICISRKPEIYPGADHTSLMLALPNKPGALYQLLGRFYAQGINLSKLERRPVDIRRRQFHEGHVDVRRQVLQIQFLRQLGQPHYRLHRSFPPVFTGPGSPAARIHCFLGLPETAAALLFSVAQADGAFNRRPSLFPLPLRRLYGKTPTRCGRKRGSWTGSPPAPLP